MGPTNCDCDTPYTLYILTVILDPCTYIHTHHIHRHRTLTAVQVPLLLATSFTVISVYRGTATSMGQFNDCNLANQKRVKIHYIYYNLIRTAHLFYTSLAALLHMIACQHNYV